MSAAARRGSASRVIGLPTTRQLAPDAMAAAGVIGMAVTDDSPADCTAHGIEIEIPRRAIKAFWRWLQQEVRAEHAVNVAVRWRQGRRGSVNFNPGRNASP